MLPCSCIETQLKTYIISHHSQTVVIRTTVKRSLRPILFHIILKQLAAVYWPVICLRPILFHIILKLGNSAIFYMLCLRPILFHIILKLNAG